jgi:ADP-ribose pyrophosphatase
MENEEKKLNEVWVYRGKSMSARADEILMPDGKHAMREFAVQYDAACIAPLTAARELLFVKQFRYAIGKEILELPAGKIDKEDKNPLENAKRELFEETGATSDDYFSLGEMYPSPGFSTEKLYIFGCNVSKIGAPHPDDDEILEVVKIPLDDAAKMVADGEIRDAKTQIAVLKLYLRMKN